MELGAPGKLGWLVPWHPLGEETHGNGLIVELRREICDRHLLHGVPVRAVATRQDCDDVLFALLDGTGRFAVVHLTFARHRESNPSFPQTMIFDDWGHFERDGMNADHADWIA